MKRFSKIFLLLLLLLSYSGAFAQKYYDEQWKKVDENSKKGTFKTNLPIVLDIQKQAMKDNNALELIRSLKAEFSIANTVSDIEQNDSSSKFFSKLQSTESKLKGEGKLVFDVLMNSFFLDYYAMNSWEIDERTSISTEDLSQIETWSRLDFKNYLTKNFQKLDQQKSEMEKIPLKRYQEIFSDTKNIEYFPTLMDWYALKKKSFLSDSELFTKNELSENQAKINAIFDELITQNTGNSKLYFMNEKINSNCNYTLCKDRLQQLQNLLLTKTEGDYKVLIMSQIVEELIGKKKQSDALAIISQAKKQYPESPFIENIKNQENQIINPVLKLSYEQQTQNNMPIHFVADYKNISEFSLTIYEVKDNFSQFLQYSNNNSTDAFRQIKKNLVRKEVYRLNAPQDYQSHKTSLEIKPLPSGIYIAEYSIAGVDPKETDSSQNLYFLVSGNKIIYQNKSETNQLLNELKLVSSESGKTIAGENLSFYEFVSDKSLNKTDGKTDAKGVFRFPATTNKQYYRTILIRQPKTNDFQIMHVYGNNIYQENGLSDKQIRTKAQIFIDRGIYRPGQTVYFKVINTKIDKEIESVVPAFTQKITLFDANGQEVSSQSFTTNEFGSYHGSFTLPKGKLNGHFYLKTDDQTNGYKDFSVEEYKRPKFEVVFEPVKDEYKYGQTIELKGKATMFSGVALSNATVNYEIKKNDIRWMYFRWYPRSYTMENSILGNVKTNEKGEFIIKLNLQKDEKLEGIQINNYEINASVTDINGETQTADTQLKVASVSHYITADQLGNAFDDENVKLKVETKNYNGQDLKKPYEVKLSKLEAPNRIFRNNFKGSVQNLPAFSKEEFIAKFPHDYYDKNDNPENWKAQVISEKTEKSGNLDLGKLKAGDYRLELFNIEGKDTIKTIQQFSVWDKRALHTDQKNFLEVIAPKNELLRGEKAKVYVYSAIPGASANVFIQDGSGKTVSEVHPFKNGLLEYVVDIPKNKDISVLNLQFQVVAFNDVQTKSIDLKIKNTEPPLQIETTTFRDKIEPGSKEKWSVKITGSSKEKISAEVLANMYDLSLDQFESNTFIWQNLYVPFSIITSYDLRQNLSDRYFQKRLMYYRANAISIPGFDWFDNLIFSGTAVLNELQGRVSGIRIYNNAVPAPMAQADTIKARDVEEVVVRTGAKSMAKMEVAAKDEGAGDDKLSDSEDLMEKIPVRQNLNETAFFYPDLRTDSEGNVSFEFTSPEALTKWKLMFLAHTKDARAATLEKEVVTQKEFSVTPNYPRFLREGDELNLQSKLSNLTDKKLSGYAGLQILDAFTNEDISDKFGLSALTAVSRYNKEQAFSLDANGNSVVAWKVKVPENVSSIILKVVAKAGKYSDGEQQAVAVLPNRILVTDAVPVFVKEGQTKTFELENLKNADSKTIANVSNTLELTTNPIWEIMFALPSLKNDPNSSADVVFNKWFADVLASEIFRSNPKMKTVFEQYQEKGLLKSNLEKNQELKQLLLEETPWVLESKNEAEQMQKLALLFDANTMKNSISQDWDDLRKLQNPDGSFSWYPGYPGSYATSLYILKSLGKINAWLKDNVKNYQNSDQKEMVKNLIGYIDGEIEKYADPKDKNVWTNWTLDYLDTRNYWEKEYPLKGKGAALKSQVKQKAKTAKLTEFTFFGLHRAALLMNDYGLKDVSDKLMNYLKETSVESKTQGVYWKQNLDDWGWFRSKLVNHAGAVEAFSKLKPEDQSFIEEMKIWLVTQKEVNSWGSSRGTAEVIYTILNSGKSWTGTESDKATIIWGGKELKPQTEAAGYVKSTVNPDVLDKSLATVTITKPGPGIVQGGLFWQYYEDLNKIKSSENYLSVTKELYRKIKTVNGEELQKISPETPLKVGDKITVRMILNTDRPMEFIHIKDMRAAGFEPVDVLSGYQWKNSLAYYQSTKDASTNFYIERMPKGKYVFEYDLIANASGKFSNGITTIQNYYAPQMSSHTKGMNVEIKE